MSRRESITPSYMSRRDPIPTRESITPTFISRRSILNFSLPGREFIPISSFKIIHPDLFYIKEIINPDLFYIKKRIHFTLFYSRHGKHPTLFYIPGRGAYTEGAVSRDFTSSFSSKETTWSPDLVGAYLRRKRSYVRPPPQGSNSRKG
jgi:hypothetical protein